MFVPAKAPFYGAQAASEIGNSDVAIFGAPHGTPYPDMDNQPFASAPDALRLALEEDSRWTGHWDFDLDGPLLAETDFCITDLGNLATAADDGAGNRGLIEQATRQIAENGTVPLMIGGDDSTPIPFIRGLESLGPLTIIQIDAHIDWRNQRRGEPMGFSSTMRRASEMAHVEKVVQAGIRGLGSARREEVEFAREWGAKIVTAREFHRVGLASVLQHLGPNENCLITLDCDALDAGIMPAVMAPTPGGLSYLQTIDLIAAICETGNLVAFDMIEFVPERDLNGTAAITAARIIANVLGGLARKQR